MPIDPAKLNALLDEQEAQRTRHASLTAPGIAPSDMARAQSIAGKRGLPPLVVADNLGEWDEREHLDAAESAAKESPAFGRWFQQPEHAALAKGDVPALSRLSKAVARSIGTDTDRSWGEFGRDLAIRYKGVAREGLVGLAETPVNLVNTLNGWLNASARDLAGVFGQTPGSYVPTLQQPEWLQTFRRTTEAINAEEADRGASFKLTAQDAARPDSFLGALSFAAENPSSLATDLAGSFGAMSSSVVPGSKVATIGAQALQQASMAAADVRRELTRRGVSAEAANASAADTFGLATLVGVLAPNLVPGGGAFESLIARDATDQLTGRLTRRAATALAGETASEGLEEGGVQAAQNVGTGDPLMKGVGAATAMGATLGFGMGGVVTGFEAYGDYRDARTQAQNRTIFQALRSMAGSYDGARTVSDIVEAVADSQTGKLAPQALASLVQGAAPDANVYLSADQARTLFQSEKISADAFVADLTGDNLAELEATGGDIVVPMATFVAKIATLPNAADVAQHVRLSADHLSRAELESEALDERLAEWFGDTDAAADRADPENAKADSGEQVTQDVLGMLMASGRYRPADAELQAKVVGRVFGRMAARSGQDAFDLYSKYKLRINGQGGTQSRKPNTLDPRTDALLLAARSGQIPSARDAGGPSLVDALVQMGGVVDAGGELRSFDALKQRPGLVNSRGLDLDRAREAMAEAGYLPEDSTVADLLDAIDRDLRGDFVFSEGNRDAAVSKFRDEALDLQRGMDDNDTLRNMSAADVQALSNQELHDLLFPPERSLLQKVGDKVRGLFQSGRDGGTVGRDEAARSQREALQDLRAIGGRAPQSGWVEATRVRGSDGKPAIVHRGSSDGTTRVENFDPAQLGRASDNANAVLGVWFSSWSQDAARYGEVGDYYLDLRNPKQYTADTVPDLDDQAEFAALRRSLEAAGHDGIVLDYRDAGGPVQFVLFKPEQVIPAGRDLFQPAYHGSPHRFDHFSLQHIGTGEGAQVYGWGMYFASERDIAEHYRKALGGSDSFAPKVRNEVTDTVANYLTDGRDLADAKAAARERLARSLARAKGYGVTDDVELNRHIADVEANLPLLDSLTLDDFTRKHAGQLYQVEVPEDEDLLDWDKSLSEQPEKVRAALERAFPEYFAEGWMSASDGQPQPNAKDFGASDERLRAAGFEIGVPAEKVTGETFYRAIRADARGANERAASEALRSIGIPGLRYLDGNSRAGGEGTHNYVIWDEAAIGEPTTFYQPDGGAAPRGRLRIGIDRSMSIDLFKGADLSTFLHESAHFFLEVMQDVAESSPEVAAELAVIRQWVGNDGSAFTEDQHEQFARGWEAYLREGKAPSPDLQPMFSRFRAWLLDVYRALTQLNVTLTDDVRGVFDRMLATDAEIDAAQAKQGMAPMALADEARALLTPKQWEAYVAATAAATEEARAEVLAKLLAAHKREAAAWWKEQLAAVTAEVEAEFEAAPIVRAWRVLSGRGPKLLPKDQMGTAPVGARVDGGDVPGIGPTEFEIREVPIDRLHLPELDSAGQLPPEKQGYLGPYTERAKAGEQPPNLRGFELDDGRIKIVDGHRRALAAKAAGKTTVRVAVGVAPQSTLLHGLRLDRAALVAAYGEQWVKENLLRLGVYRKEGGVHPDTAAAALGFSSGDALVKALSTVHDLQARVRDEALARMRERHPDPATDGSLPERAMDAVHNHKRVAALEAEQGILAKLAGQPAPPARLVREYARRKIAGLTLRGIRPNDYLVAERRAARLAAKEAAAGNYAEALQHKRAQALNAALYAEARKAQEAQARIARYLAKFQKTKTRAKLGKLGGAYLEQIDALLERFEFRPVSGKDAARRKSLAEWVEAQRAAGSEPDVPAKLLDAAFRKPHEDMTLAELRELRDTVKQIAHLANLKGKLLLAGDLRDAAEIDGAMAQSVRDHAEALPDTPGEPTKAAGRMKEIGWLRATLGAATDIARQLDGFANLGPVWSHTVGVIRDAINGKVNPALKAAQEAVAGLYTRHYAKAELRALSDRFTVSGVRGTWTRARILALALNWGNEGNREAVLSQAKQKLSPEEIGLLFRQLDGRDWDFVQGVWDLIDGYWPQIAETQRQRKGLAPAKVQASAFTVTTKDGQAREVRGGYYPLKYEADSVRGMREEADDFYEAIRTGRFAKAATRDGHTVERVGSGGRTVALDLDVIDGHLRNVIRDIHLGDAVNYVHNVLHGSEFAQAVADTGNAELVRGLDTWLRDTASGEMGPRTRAEQLSRAIRTNFTGSVLTYKFVSAALQVTGIVQTSVVLGKGYTLEGVQRFTRRPRAMLRYVTEASPFMAARAQSHVEAVQTVQDAKAGRIKATHGAMLRHGYWMIGQVQRLVDMATWLGAEAKGMADFGDVAKARAYADDVVARAQGSGEFIDKTAMQRGTLGDNVRQSEWIKAFTVLQSYLIAKSNVAYERTSKARRNIDGINARSVWEGTKWAGDMVNLFVVEAVIVAAIRGGLPDDDDEDGWLDDWAKFLAAEGASNLFGGVPGIGSAVSELRGYDTKGVVAGMWGAAGGLIEQYKQGELDAALAKAHVRFAGYLFGIPSSQLNKTIDAIAAREDGEDVSVADYLTGPPKQ